MIHIHTFDTRDKLYAPLILDYTKRMSSVTIFSHKPSKAEPHIARQQDANTIIPILQKKYADRTRIYLSEHGKTLASEDFSQQFCLGNDCVFILGGTYGLDNSINDHINTTLAFGAMTMSHHIIKLVLLEQIWRGYCIQQGKSYHR